MSNEITKTASSRKEVAGANFYDNFLEILMKICAEEDVLRVPEIVIENKLGDQIADPEVISRKLSQICASLEKETVQKGMQDVSKLSQAESVHKQKVQIVSKDKSAVPEAATKKEGAPVQKDIGVSETEDQISAPCPQVELCRQKKGKLRVISGLPGTLTALAMKSSKIESALLRTLGKCVSCFPTISQLRLENCRLKPEDAFLISVMLREIASLKQLILDENPLGDMCYSCLLQTSNPLLHLSLCGCKLGDLGMVYLCAGLEHIGRTSHPLVRLNLANNLITCKGAQILANALRTNRVLLSVTMSGNQIQNTGAIALAEVFQRFQLREDERLERRGRYFCQNLRHTSRQGYLEDLHPFLFELDQEEGKAFCKGNFTLRHLNLSYNSIGLPGLLAFHQAVLYQESVLQLSEKGLLSLYFQGNLFPENRRELQEILRIFDARLDLQRKLSKTSSLESRKSISKTSGLN